MPTRQKSHGESDSGKRIAEIILLGTQSATINTYHDVTKICRRYKNPPDVAFFRCTLLGAMGAIGMCASSAVTTRRRFFLPFPPILLTLVAIALLLVATPSALAAAEPLSVAGAAHLPFARAGTTQDAPGLVVSTIACAVPPCIRTARETGKDLVRRDRTADFLLPAPN